MTTHVALILAAGASRRMGHPKQLITLGGRSLLCRAVATARAAGLRPIVVLGAHRAEVEAELDPSTARVFNPDWEQGMGGSIVAGLRSALTSELTTLTVTLCDQPRVTAPDLASLRSALDMPEVDVAAALYAGVLGPPACFSALCFDHLLGLEPHQGARRLLRGGTLRVVPVPMEAAALDLDRPEDVARLLGDGVDHF